MPVSIDFVVITPEAAKEIVAREEISINDFYNRQNSQIRSYATDMAAGRWVVNGDAIIFSTSGKLIDGRKRLIAAAEYGLSFPTFVTRGIEDDVAEYIDSHRRRNSRDVFFVGGHNDAGPLAATAATIVDIARTGLPSQQILSHGNLLKLVEDTPDMLTINAEAAEFAASDYYSPSDFAALLYLMRSIDRNQADLFFTALESVLSTPEKEGKTPIHILAKELLGMKAEVDAGASAGSSRTRYIRTVFTIKAWNAFRTKATIKRLRFGEDEEAPRLHGLPQGLFELYVSRLDPRSAGGDRGVEYKALSDGLDTYGEVVTITPEEASKMLLLNGPLLRGEGRNRKRSEGTIVGYAREMVNGTWMLTGQSIKFARNGQMIDGQHRLYACIRSGIPFDTVVMHNVDDDVFSTFDVAHQHTVAHILKERGEHYGNTMQGALRLIWNYREAGLKSTQLKPNLTEMLDLYEEYPKLAEYAVVAHNNRFREHRIPAAVLTALIAIFTEVDPEATPEFFDKLATGANLDLGTPILRLRKKLGEISNNSKNGKRLDVSADTRMYLVCIAFNAFRAGKNTVLFSTDLTKLAPPPPFDKPSAPKASVMNKQLGRNHATKASASPAAKSTDDWISVPAA